MLLKINNNNNNNDDNKVDLTLIQHGHGAQSRRSYGKRTGSSL